MTQTGHVHVGGVYIIELTVTTDGSTPLPISGAIAFRFRKPNGDTLDKTATLTSNNGSDGVATYTTVPADLDQAGEWMVQLSETSGPWYADVKRFTVQDNL